MSHLAGRALALGLAFAALASAQEIRATIYGRIIDQTGSSVPGAKVKIANRATNVATEVETNVEGNYVNYLTAVSPTNPNLNLQSRVDHVLNSKHRLYFRFARNHGLVSKYDHPIVAGYAGVSGSQQGNAAMGESGHGYLQPADFRADFGRGKPAHRALHGPAEILKGHEPRAHKGVKYQPPRRRGAEKTSLSSAPSAIRGPIGSSSRGLVGQIRGLRRPLQAAHPEAG